VLLVKQTMSITGIRSHSKKPSIYGSMLSFVVLFSKSNFTVCLYFKITIYEILIM